MVACLSALDGTIRNLAKANSWAREGSGEPEGRIGISRPSLVWNDKSHRFQRAVLALDWAPVEGSISLARSSCDHRVLMTAILSAVETPRLIVRGDSTAIGPAKYPVHPLSAEVSTGFPSALWEVP